MTLSVTKVLCDTLMPAAYCLYSYQQQQIGLSDCHITAYCGKITYILIIEHFQENYHGISCEANTFFSVYTYALKESVYQKNKFLRQATFWYTMTKCSIIIVKHAKEKTKVVNQQEKQCFVQFRSKGISLINCWRTLWFSNEHSIQPCNFY